MISVSLSKPEMLNVLAENERLRAALERLAFYGDPSNPDYFKLDHKGVQTIARAALAGSEA